MNRRPQPLGTDARRWLVGAFAVFALTTLPAAADGPMHEQITDLTRQLADHPGDPALLLRRGELNRLHEHRAEARADFQHAQRLAPDDPSPLLFLGRLALDEGKAAEAVTLLTGFVARRPGLVEGQLQLARALAQAGRPDEAVPVFSRAIALTAEPRPEWFVERCRAQAALPGDRTAEALAGLDEGLARLGQLPALQLAAIELETHRRDFDAALRRLDTLLAASERKERWLLQRGDLLRSAGRTAEARAAYLAADEAFAALNPRQQRALAMLDFRRELDGKLAALPAQAETSAPR